MLIIFFEILKSWCGCESYNLFGGGIVFIGQCLYYGNG